MKKFLVALLAAVVMGSSTRVLAQTETLSESGMFQPQHEVGVSIGAAPTSVWATISKAIVETVLVTSWGDVKYDNTSWFGSLSGEYFYCVLPKLSLGGVVCFSQDNDDMIRKSDDSKVGDRTTRFFTIMPALKWNYLQRKHYGMYMKLAAGYTFESVKEDCSNGLSDKSNSGFFNMQVSLLGIEAGGQRLRGYTELGFGEQGLLLAGLRYRF